jgi:2-polyprenyl-3-methyl-5-hydroxy-6-metoxy-1,4-benzoquinol methylase
MIRSSMATERDWKAEFERSYAGRRSVVVERVWRGVFGDEYPAGLDPFSGVSVSELERIAVEIRVGEGDTITDVGCGRGGPGLWVAMGTGADLVGIDISSTALGRRGNARPLSVWTDAPALTRDRSRTPACATAAPTR